MDAADFRSRYRGVVARLNHAFGVADEMAFEALVGELYAERDLTMRTGIARLSQSLADALTRFQLESRVSALAEREIPDARLRLDHVLKMTEEAVHRTLDLIEQAAPLAEATTRGARLLAPPRSAADRAKPGRVPGLRVASEARWTPARRNFPTKEPAACGPPPRARA